MSEELKNLTRKRGTLKSQLTTFAKFLDSITTSADAQEIISLSNASTCELAERIDRVSLMFDQFSETQYAIDCLVGDDELEKQATEREEFENRFYELIGRAKKYLIAAPNHVHDAQSVASAHSQIANSIPRVNHRLKLPTIQLSIFSGNLDAWLEFREMFESMIHKRSDLDSIEKFHYLKLSLASDALEVIRSLEFTQDNYHIAWQLLRERFDNERLLVDNHVKSIFNIANIEKESSAKLRKLIDVLNKNLRALKSLNQPTESWDTLIIHIISQKLDPTTTREWEELKSNNQIPDLESLKSFLKGRADLLETLESKSGDKHTPRTKPVATKAFFSSSRSCPICKDNNHSAYNCQEFLKFTPKERSDCAKRHKLCLNCLRPGHFQSSCKSGSCQKCGAKHNTLLHFPGRASSAETPPRTAVPVVTSTVSNHAVSGTSYTLLSTALVHVKDKEGVVHEIRALLDNGSQSNFISQELCSELNLSTCQINVAVTGITQTSTPIKQKVEVELHSRYSNFHTNISCLVIPEITENIPSISFDPSKLNLPRNIVLADPTFSTSGKIHILLGANIFWDLLSIGQIKLGKHMPTLQKTRLGWIVSGPLSLSHPTTNSRVKCNFSKNGELHEQIQKFWKIEECLDSKNAIYSSEEKGCEEHFVENTVKLQDGHFQVKIPFKNDTSLLGESKETAVKRFYGIERKLHKDPELKRQYHEFMVEYEQLNHMTRVETSKSDQARYYIPHHAVMKKDSTTTKLRVVFDASAKTTSGYSLNDLQMVGPVIQQDLLDIVLRFRTHNVVMTSDIMKMYRQVSVAPDQRPLQSIIWRDDPTQPLQTFELNTVTYGTSAASFLAIRSLHQVGLDCEESHPRVSEIIRSDFYVDDLLSGASTVEEANNLKNDLTAVLSQNGFLLRKWTSNIPQLLKEEESSERCDTLQIGKDERTKTLGLIWNHTLDTFQYSIADPDHKRHTKRSVLSCIAQIFDPMGLVTPVITTAKIFMQMLWQAQLSWDESLPLDLYTKWSEFYNKLSELNCISIKRHITCHDPKTVEFHGFSDSSEAAYGACIYVRSVDAQGKVHINLLCAKSKVAPLKTITIPRLELCGALILARLMRKAQSALNIQTDQVTYWCDSKIVLGWIGTEPNLLKTFVSHRVSEIQSLSNANQWNHVSTTDNPADLASRGLKPGLLQSSRLWWAGPEWLLQSDLPNVSSPDILDLPEMRNVTATLVARERIELFPFGRFSNLRRLQGAMTYILRYFHKGTGLKTGPIDAQELFNSLTALVRLAQRESFPEEYKALSGKKPINIKSKLIRLTPFLHEDGTIRVGGRLQNSNFDFNKKHPFVLDSKHRLTQLLFTDKHKRLLHAGPQLLLASVRETFWPISGRNLARQTVHKCVICFKSKPKSFEPLMGNLPKHRVVPSVPFEVVGVDYAGPFQLKDRKGRGCKTSRCYLCLFVCFVTKAIHLELVTSLSTEAFIMTLKRFVARRGRPSFLYSDNGTNFVGASSELEELGQFLTNNVNELVTASANEMITWKFIPAYSPNFGGLWEAGVKSAKSHLKRVLGAQSLTFETFYTLIVQIEAVLNSRPLSPLSSDPNDYTPLTPSHFLLGRAATSIPNYDLTDVPENRLNIYQQVEAMKQHFWERWSKEYISELQQRVKATTQQGEIQVDDLVVVKDARLPPQNWLLGRIAELIPGPDRVCRVVRVQTSKGIIKRAVTKVCPLPLNNTQPVPNKASA